MSMAWNRLGLGLGWLSLLALGGGLLELSHAKGGAPTPAEVARLFKTRCASCHTVPDTRFATDRAWLGQVLETA